MLLDVYENSVTYKGQNIKNQSFAIKPEKIFYEYNGDYTDQDEVNQFNREMQSLMEFEFVILDYERGIPVISKIKLNIDSKLISLKLKFAILIFLASKDTGLIETEGLLKKDFTLLSHQIALLQDSAATSSLPQSPTQRHQESHSRNLT